MTQAGDGRGVGRRGGVWVMGWGLALVGLAGKLEEGVGLGVGGGTGG